MHNNLVHTLRHIFRKYIKNSKYLQFGSNNKIPLAIRLKTNLIGNNNEFLIGRAFFNNNFFFKIHGSDNHIIIEDGVALNGGNVWIEANNCILKIGKETTFESVHIALVEDNTKVTIGEDCMFGNNIEMRTGDSHAILKNGIKINNGQNIEIKNHVWIASNVTILKGSTIEENSIIGTGSIVAGFVDPNSIFVGNKIRKVNDGVTWTRIK